MWFDFDEAQILGQLFRLDHQYIVTDRIEKELKSLNVPMLKKFGFQSRELTGELITELVKLRARYTGPGIADLSALVLARGYSYPLYTRDSLLQEAANLEGVVVRESHTLLEEMIDEGILKRAEAADALAVMNSRLLTTRLDWKDMIKKWRKP
ncbi:MAG: hypothetical protein ABFD46_02890 [Armatimonadota bacterium]